MRVGVHPGPVVAGVIGRKKFAYDLWGDVVPRLVPVPGGG
jgi:guanylate cyclase